MSNYKSKEVEMAAIRASKKIPNPYQNGGNKVPGEAPLSDDGENNFYKDYIKKINLNSNNLDMGSLRNKLADMP